MDSPIFDELQSRIYKERLLYARMASAFYTMIDHHRSTSEIAEVLQSFGVPLNERGLTLINGNAQELRDLTEMARAVVRRHDHFEAQNPRVQLQPGWFHVASTEAQREADEVPYALRDLAAAQDQVTGPAVAYDNEDAGPDLLCDETLAVLDEAGHNPCVFLNDDCYMSYSEDAKVLDRMEKYAQAARARARATPQAAKARDRATQEKT